MTIPDRRRYPRTRAAWPVTIEPFSGEPVSGEVIDVSLSGVKVSAGTEIRVGTAVTLRMVLPGSGQRLEIVARAVRRDPDGMALDFIDLTEADAARMESHVVSAEARRQAPRASVSLPVTVRGRFERPQKGSTLDLSAFGARVTTEGRLNHGEMVSLDLPLLDGGVPMRLPALVWEISERGAVLVFHGLDQGDFQRLRAYVDRALEPG